MYTNCYFCGKKLIVGQLIYNYNVHELWDNYHLERICHECFCQKIKEED